MLSVEVARGGAASWKSLPFTLECTISGTPVTRVVALRHPGADRALDTADDIVVTLL